MEKVAKAQKLCHEVLSMIIPDLKVSQDHALIEERMTQGKSLKKLGDEKMKRSELRPALLDFTYAALRFYQAAVAMAKQESFGRARSLLEQTGRYAVGCASANKQSEVQLSRALLYYVAAVCFGKAFSVSAASTRRDHKKLSELVKENKGSEADPQQLKVVVETTDNVYKALEWYHYAVKLAGTQLELPSNVLLQTESELMDCVDKAVNAIK